MRNYVKSDPTSTASDIAKVTIFDLQNKLIGYSGTFREGVTHVFHQWGEIFILGSKSKVRIAPYLKNLTVVISAGRALGHGQVGCAI